MSPGPNVIIVTLIGYHVAGIAGALVATVAMCGPTALLAHYLGRVGSGSRCPLADRHPGRAGAGLGRSHRRKRLHSARAADHTWVAGVVTAATAVPPISPAEPALDVRRRGRSVWPAGLEGCRNCHVGLLFVTDLSVTEGNARALKSS